MPAVSSCACARARAARRWRAQLPCGRREGGTGCRLPLSGVLPHCARPATAPAQPHHSRSGVASGYCCALPRLRPACAVDAAAPPPGPPSLSLSCVCCSRAQPMRGLCSWRRVWEADCSLAQHRGRPHTSSWIPSCLATRWVAAACPACWQCCPPRICPLRTFLLPGLRLTLPPFGRSLPPPLPTSNGAAAPVVAAVRRRVGVWRGARGSVPHGGAAAHGEALGGCCAQDGRPPPGRRHLVRVAAGLPAVGADDGHGDGGRRHRGRPGARPPDRGGGRAIGLIAPAFAHCHPFTPRPPPLRTSRCCWTRAARRSTLPQRRARRRPGARASARCSTRPASPGATPCRAPTAPASSPATRTTWASSVRAPRSQAEEAALAPSVS